MPQLPFGGMSLMATVWCAWLAIGAAYILPHVRSLQLDVPHTRIPLVKPTAPTRRAALRLRVSQTALRLRGGGASATADNEEESSVECEAEEVLLIGARCGELEYVEKALGAGVSAQHADAHGNTALHFAAANGHVAVIDCLLATAPASALANLEGNTPLHWAVENLERPAVARLLAQEDAPVLADNRFGVSPLDLAYRLGDDGVDASTWLCAFVRTCVRIFVRSICHCAWAFAWVHQEASMRISARACLYTSPHAQILWACFDVTRAWPISIARPSLSIMRTSGRPKSSPAALNPN